MKGLLQSKIFRKNLSKWLFMYILSMGLFTTVITYSKYISNMLDEGDAARVSKFNIQLKYCNDETCDNPSTDAPVLKKYRPFDEMEYYFALDSSNLEVNANLILTVNVDRHFKIKEVKEIINGESKEINNISKNNTDKKVASIDKAVTAGSKELIKYKVTVVYDEDVIDYNKDNCTSATNGCTVVNGVVKEEGSDTLRYIFDENAQYNILTVGYSAEQAR